MTTEVVTTAEEVRPLPLPENLESWEEEQETLLDQAQEAGGEYTLPPIEIPGPEHIGRAMKRIGYFDRMMSLVSAPFNEEITERQKDIAYLQEEIKRLESEKATACKPWERRKSWYKGPIEAFMRALNAMDQKIKSWPTPWGVLTLKKASQPTWDYGDSKNEREVADLLNEWETPFYRTKYEIEKDALKEAAYLGRTAKIENGAVFVRLNNGFGEIEWRQVPGFTVDMDPPAKFEIKPPKDDKPKPSKEG